MKFSSVVHRGFSTAEAARLSGLTPRQLDHWDRLGFLKPSARSAAGYGTARRYSFTDLVRLRVAARLRSSGVGLARLRRCAEVLKRLDVAGEGDLGGARLVVVGERILWVKSDRELVDLLKDGQLMLVCSLEDAVERTVGAVSRFQHERLQPESAPTAISRRTR